VYLCFLEKSQNSVSLLHWAFLLILYRIQSAEFCEIIISLNKKSIFKVLSLVYCVPTIITSSLFIGFEHTSNDWKVEKVKYKFGITSFRR
jgi:hypothetical protein